MDAVLEGVDLFRFRKGLLVTALRSDSYEQGIGCLKERVDRSCRHCVLGVACEVAKANGCPVLETGGCDGRRLFGPVGGEWSIGWLPVVVQEWYGFRHGNGSFRRVSEHVSLSSLNDNGVSFEELAELIDSEPAGLFVWGA